MICRRCAFCGAENHRSGDCHYRFGHVSATLDIIMELALRLCETCGLRHKVYISCETAIHEDRLASRRAAAQHAWAEILAECERRDAVMRRLERNLQS